MKIIARRRHILGALTLASGLSVTGSAYAEYPYDEPVTDPPAATIEPVTIPEVSSSDLAEPVAIEEPVAAPAAVTAAPCQCCNSTCCTKEKKKAATAKMKGAYKGVFYANDYSYLDDPCYTGHWMPGDLLKGLHCGDLDIGGEARVRYHNETNMRGLGLTGRDDNFWLTRVRLFSDYRMNEYFRFYGEYLYADSGGERFNNRPIEENRGEIQNLFVDANLLSGKHGDLAVRVGRQELLLGAQRLISPLDWANTRRSFQGVRGMYKGSKWDVDGFYVNPLRRTAEFESKIDPANLDVQFFGVYGTRKGLDIGQVETYYLGLNNKAADFDYHTIGSRVVGSNDNFLYELEGGYQFGTNSNGTDHYAGFMTAGLGKKLSICTACGEWNPTVWMWYDWASGEDDFNEVARGDNGFDHLFPLAHKYNGFMDLFGRRNLNDVNAQFIAPLGTPNLKLLLWYHYFFLDQKTTPYGVTMAPFNTANRAEDRELGHELDILLNIDLNARNNIWLGYSFFTAGDYFKKTPGVTAYDAQFMYFQYQSRF